MNPDAKDFSDRFPVSETYVCRGNNLVMKVRYPRAEYPEDAGGIYLAVTQENLKPLHLSDHEADWLSWMMTELRAKLSVRAARMTNTHPAPDGIPMTYDTETGDTYIYNPSRS